MEWMSPGMWSALLATTAGYAVTRRRKNGIRGKPLRQDASRSA